MTKFERGGDGNNGSMRETATMIALLTIIAGVGAAFGLDRLTREHDLPRIAIMTPSHRLQERMAALPRAGCPQRTASALRQATVDYMPVGSIPANLAQPVTPDPCPAAQK